MPQSDDGRAPPSTREQGSRSDEEALDSARRPASAPVETPTLTAASDLSGSVLESRTDDSGISDKFVDCGPIGRGGSGVVVRAFDKDILRNVAIKVLTPDLCAGGPETARFAEEARITGQLEHPNIPPVYEFGATRGGGRFLCMRLVDGDTLEETLVKLGKSRLEPHCLADLLQVFLKVCEAVSFAHSRGVIHRDLKPSNIMISDFGQVYVLDWGIAHVMPAVGSGQRRVRLVDDPGTSPASDPPGALVGTPCYMAPEQLQGLHDKFDERTDVFALGGTLYQILTGQPPLTPEIVRAIWTRKSLPPIAPPDQVVSGTQIPAELSRIAMRALAYDPAERYPLAVDLKRDLEHFQRGAWHLPRTAFPAGTVIVREGDPGSAAFVILEGRCAAYRIDGDVQVDLRVMGPGEVFGETAVFSDKPRTASIRALTDVVLQVVTREVLSQAVGLNSWMGAFVKALADRFREADERLRILERPPRTPREP